MGTFSFIFAVACTGIFGALGESGSEKRSIIMDWLDHSSSRTLKQQANRQRIEHYTTISLDKILEVMGPGLLPVRLILSLMPFTAPAIPLAAWAEAYYEERQKGNDTQNHHSSNHSGQTQNSIPQINAYLEGQNEPLKCKTIVLPNLKVAYDKKNGKCVMAEYRIAGEYHTLENREDNASTTSNEKNPHYKTIQLPALELLLFHDDNK